MKYFIYMNSEAATYGHKGFVSKRQVTKSNKLSIRYPIKTTTEFAFAMEFDSFENAFIASVKLGGILLERKDI